MGMPVPTPVTTIEELLALPEDGLRHELLDGEHVVTPAPALRHQQVIRDLLHALEQALRECQDVDLLTSPADMVLGPRSLVQPDIFVTRRHPDRPPKGWRDVGIPLLAIEILSPSTAARDRGKKRRLYLEAGVEEYWIVDMDARIIERWRAGDQRPEILENTLEWSLTVGVSGAIDIPSLFRRVTR